MESEHKQQHHSVQLSTEEQQLQQLCFNRTHFQRADFNVERFVNLARKRATLDQLHTDLRTYLRYLQNSMIELINDDYADFVNLSSALATLHESVDKISEDVKSNWSQFGTSIADLQKCADSAQECLAELCRKRRKQAAARDKIALLQSIKRLHLFLNKAKHTVDDEKKLMGTFWYSKLVLLISAVKLWENRVKVLPVLLTSILQQTEGVETKCYEQVREFVVAAIGEELKQIANDTLIEEANALRNPILTRKFKKSTLAILLASLQLINDQDNAVRHVVNNVINPQIGQKFLDNGQQKMDKKLQIMLDLVLKLQHSWYIQAKQSQQYTREVANFLDTCLLNYVIASLDEHFSTVLVPSDVRLFHNCFQLVTKFIQHYQKQTKSHNDDSQQQQLDTLLRCIQDKFHLIVYFKLATQSMSIQLKEQSAPEMFKPISPQDGNQCCISAYSNSILTHLEALYSPDMFLPALAHKFWEFTLYHMDAYGQWVQAVLDYSISIAQQAPEEGNIPKSFSTTNISAKDNNRASSVSPVPRKAELASNSTMAFWFVLAALHRDTQMFDAQLFQFCLSTIWTYLRQLHIDPTAFGQCLSHFSEQLVKKRADIQQALIELLGTELAKNLSAVSDIPRQYRWTKRPQPVGFSAYLGISFSVCEQFAEQSIDRLGWNEGEMRNVLSLSVGHAVTEFCDRAEKVLDAVEQTGSSLLRFKQRKAAVSGQQQQADDGADTDDAKIRAQLCFDANLVRQRAEEYGIDSEAVQRLARIEQRAAATAMSAASLTTSTTSTTSASTTNIPATVFMAAENTTKRDEQEN